MSLRISAIAEKATVRLVPDAYFKPPVLKALVDTDEELAILAEVEGQTSQRQIAERQGLADLDPRELAFRSIGAQLQRWGHTFVNAAFAYTRAGGNRFNDDHRGAWYCAFSEETAIQEVAFHRTRELGFIGEYRDEMIYTALLADFIGDFPDLRGVDPTPTCLHADPAIGYPAGQSFARTLRADGHAGLIYPSVRDADGICFVAFAPQIVQNVRPAAKWNLIWDGSPSFSVIANP